MTLARDRMPRWTYLTDERRYPLLTPDARRHLDDLRQHVFAPAWNHRCGDRLTAEGLQRVRQFERDLQDAPPCWRPGEPPAWVYPFASRVIDTVPRYADLRAQGASSAPSCARDFAQLPTTSRDDLARVPWMLVPDGRSLDDLIVYDTSGRTGHPIVVPTHPETSSMYLPLLRAALATAGATLAGGPGRVSLINVCRQRHTFTFVSVSSFLDWAGCAKVNLDPGDWRDPDDRVRFLDACDPWIYTGDPMAFATLAALPLATRPRALVSTSMTLLDGLRERLESRFGCPVIDLYSLTESGPVAVASTGTFRILPHDVYVEVLDPKGRPCADGERGEVTLTGGRNPFVPLLWYRTGDWAALATRDGRPCLVDVEGRPPVLFRDEEGRPLNNVDVTNALRPLDLTVYTVHQEASGDLGVRTPSGGSGAAAVRRALSALFGVGVRVSVKRLGTHDLPAGKVVHYSSDVPPDWLTWS